MLRRFQNQPFEFERTSRGRPSASQLPLAPFCLTKEKIKITSDEIKLIQVPSYLDFKPSNLFEFSSRMKSHDWKEVITMHLIHHLVDGVKQDGPVYGWWMYPYERFNSWICRRALNRYHPEAIVIETYRVNTYIVFAL